MKNQINDILKCVEDDLKILEAYVNKKTLKEFIEDRITINEKGPSITIDKNVSPEEFVLTAIRLEYDIECLETLFEYDTKKLRQKYNDIIKFE